ncbi:MAG: hypothetical protein WA869_24730, partial [Alloacidobacterium sp.]
PDDVLDASRKGALPGQPSAIVAQDIVIRTATVIFVMFILASSSRLPTFCMILFCAIYCGRRRRPRFPDNPTRYIGRVINASLTCQECFQGFDL